MRLPPQTDLNDFMVTLDAATVLAQPDMDKLVSYVNNEFGKMMPFNATLGNNYTANICEFPGVGFGVQVGATMSKINLDGLKSLDLQYVPKDSFDKIPSNFQLPYPAINFHLKTGLPFMPIKTDLGVRGFRFNYTLKQEDTEVRLGMNSWGVETRFEIIADKAENIFGLISLVSFDSYAGNIGVKMLNSNTQQNTMNTIPYDTRYDVTVTADVDWNIQSLGLKFILNKSLFFLNPYIGVGVNLNSGVNNAGLSIKSNVTMSPVSDPNDQATGTVEAKSTNTKPPKSTDFRLIGGLDFKFPIFIIGASYEWGGSDIYGASLAIRFQIP